MLDLEALMHVDRDFAKAVHTSPIVHACIQMMEIEGIPLEHALAIAVGTQATALRILVDHNIKKSDLSNFIVRSTND